MSTAPSKRPEKIHALTSLRFFAAFYVVIYHTLGLAFGDLIAGTVVEQGINLGYISVSFFFLLSGYILARVYLQRGQQVKLRDFYAARFARVYPLFFFTLLADTPFLLFSRAQQLGWKTGLIKTAATFAAHLVMLQAWIPGMRGIDQPNWSLSTEALFYLIFPFLGLLLWRLRGRAIWVYAALIWVMSQLAVYLIAPHLAFTTAEFNPLLHIGTFALGILVARWQFLAQSEHGRTPPRSITVAVIFMLLVLALTVVAHYSLVIPVPNVNAGLLSPVFAMIVWACSGSKSLATKLISPPWLVVLGEASFGLYLIHMPVLHLFQALHWEHSQILYPVYLTTCIGLSILSFYFVETPTRLWILHKFKARTKETREAAADAQ